MRGQYGATRGLVLSSQGLNDLRKSLRVSGDTGYCNTRNGTGQSEAGTDRGAGHGA
jgi:hypothetical protein